MRKQWERVGTVGVDSGLMWVGDPCYIMPDDATGNPGADWYKFCDELERDTPAQEWGFVGMSIQHFGGDGVYPVFIRRGKDGLVSDVRISFAQEDEDELDNER